MFLEGKNDQIRDELSARMDSLSSELKFEEASVIRDQIKDLRIIQESQFVSGEKGDVDVIAMAQESGAVCIHVIFVRAGRVLGNKNFYPRFVLEREPRRDHAGLHCPVLSQRPAGTKYSPRNTVQSSAAGNGPAG